MKTTIAASGMENAVKEAFREEVYHTGLTEYGVSWQGLASGEEQVPPQGARFDIYFEGTVTGNGISGKVKGIDYLIVRADGKFQLRIFASILTDDGEIIALDNPGQRCRATFPLLGAMGTRDTATVYFELGPGEELGRHTDSAEELLFILEGEAEATIGALAYESGYADQAHFIRDFKHFTGEKPTVFLKEREQFIVNPNMARQPRPADGRMDL